MKSYDRRHTLHLPYTLDLGGSVQQNLEPVTKGNYDGYLSIPRGGGGGRGGGNWVFRGAHTLVIKIKKYPYSTDFGPKKHPYFNKNADFFH